VKSGVFFLRTTKKKETNMSNKDLWIKVMNKVLSTQGEHSRKNLRLESEQSECELCRDTGCGVLIRCSHEKCSKEYHLDCAFHQGGLSLDENFVLTFQCDTHFRHVLFCICKERYDEKKSMVCCDECIEWFHNSCVGINAKEILKIDRYVCSSCKTIIKEKKSIPKQLRERNMEKEQKSYCNQTAMRAVGLLAEIVGSTCPIIDALNVNGKVDFRIEEFEELLIYLSSFDRDVPTPLINKEDKEFNTDILIKLDVYEIVKIWRQKLLKFLSSYKTWLKDAKNIYSKTLSSLSVSLHENQVIKANKVYDDVNTLINRLNNTFKAIPIDLEGFLVFFDIISWMKTFLQVVN
jgi:hypothetical protein